MQFWRRLGRNGSYLLVFTFMSKTGTDPISSYLHICQSFLKVAVGEKRPTILLLSGSLIYAVCTFAGTAEAVAGKKAESNLSPKAMVQKWIHDLGGTVLTQDNAQTILGDLPRHLTALFC